ncbi:MAG: phosphotransferase enzyme family protein [Sphaerochaeta sp.]
MKTEDILSHFKIDGKLVSIKHNNEGHINTTFMSTFDDNGKIAKYTHQKINKFAFKNPENVMHNIVSITEHIQSKIKDLNDRDKRCLQVVLTNEGLPYYKDNQGEYYRTYRFIDDVKTYSKVVSADTAFYLGQGIATFQKQLNDFDGNTLSETIPDFHNMHSRYKKLKDAIEKDEFKRVDKVQSEIEYLLKNEERGCLIWNDMIHSKVPVHVTHNDTKINNVLFNEDGTEALCVIDLDTVMPGTILFDTGDMIRTATSTLEEDAENYQEMRCNIDYFRSLIEGYLSTASSYLTDREKDLIVESGRNITQIMAVRFLTDYLDGDVYYSIEKKDHNRDRCRTQIAFMKNYDEMWEELTKIVNSYK